MILRLSTFITLVLIIAVIVSPIATIYSLIKWKLDSVITGIIVFVVSLYLLKIFLKKV